MAESQTYLQLVNRVLVNLRESQVTSVAPSAYANVVGQFVNLAKEKVEDAPVQWRRLTTSLTWNTVVGQQTYILDGTGTPSITSDSGRFATTRSYLLRDRLQRAMVFRTTAQGTAGMLTEMAYEDLIADNRLAVPITNNPPYAFAYTTAGGTPAITFARPPDAVYAMEARFVVPQPELTTDAATMIIPYQPVVALATAFAMQERGEELGTNSDWWMELYKDQLANYIVNEQQVDTLEFRND